MQVEVAVTSWLQAASLSSPPTRSAAGGWGGGGAAAAATAPAVRRCAAMWCAPRRPLATERAVAASRLCQYWR